MSTTYYGVRIGATDSVMYLCARHARPYGGARIPMTDPTNRRCQECRAPLSKRPARRRRSVARSVAAAAVLAVAGCATADATTFTARVTYYSREECGGRRTSTGTRPIEGTTIAVDPRLIPYGRTVEIPALKGIVGDGLFTASDTGRWVKSRRASRAVGRSEPVVDVFLASRARVAEVTRALGRDGHFLEVTLR